MADTLDIAGIDKAVLLKELHDGTGPAGLGMLNATFGKMSLEEARQIVAKFPRLNFDYVNGRPSEVRHHGGFVRPLRL